MLRLAVLDQGQPAGTLIVGQALPVTQQQAHWQSDAGQATGPQTAQAAGSEDLPGHSVRQAGGSHAAAGNGFRKQLAGFGEQLLGIDR